MYPVADQIYGPILREKDGERQAARDLHEAAKPFMLPTWVALPLTARENAGCSINDFIKREVGRVSWAWGHHVCLWDPRFLCFDDDPSADATHLKDILGAFVHYGCRAVPVASLNEAFPRFSIMADHARRYGSGVAVRLEFDDLGDFDALDGLLASASVKPSECVILIDLTDADLSEHDEFAQFLVSVIADLRSRGPWANVIVAGSSYPIKNPANPHAEAAPLRLEWRVWSWALGIDRSLPSAAMFGDFGADNALFRFEGGGMPIPHVRYARFGDWWVVRAGTKPASIRAVIRKIVGSPDYFGRSFSAADEFLFDCAAGLGGTGDSTRWRWINMNHHFALVLSMLAKRYGIAIPTRTATEPEQPRLVPDR